MATFLIVMIIKVSYYFGMNLRKYSSVKFYQVLTEYTIGTFALKCNVVLKCFTLKLEKKKKEKKENQYEIY